MLTLAITEINGSCPNESFKSTILKIVDQPLTTRRTSELNAMTKSNSVKQKLDSHCLKQNTHGVISNLIQLRKIFCSLCVKHKLKVKPILYNCVDMGNDV